MDIILHTIIILELSWIANSFNVYEPARVPGWNYFGYSWMDQKPSFVFRKPMAAMVDLTNDLGVAILQDYSYSRSNFAFSPYGVASVLVVLYEGARGESARQIHRSVRFPWDKDITRIGFRDIHRHLRVSPKVSVENRTGPCNGRPCMPASVSTGNDYNYVGNYSRRSHEGYLSGITLSKDGSTLKPEYKRILRFYGYDVDVDTLERTTDAPPTTQSPMPAVNDTATPGTTTEGYGTTGKDVEATNIATSTIKLEEITTLSSDETTPNLIAVEDRETQAPSTTTSVVKEEDVTETTLSLVVSTTEQQNIETVTEKDQQNSDGTTEESVTQEDESVEGVTQQTTGGGDPVTEQPSTEQDGVLIQNIPTVTEQNNQQITDQTTTEEDSSLKQNTPTATEPINMQSTQQTVESGDEHVTEQSSIQENSTQAPEDTQSTENYEPDTQEDGEKITEQNTEERTSESDDKSVTENTLTVTTTADDSSSPTVEDEAISVQPTATDSEFTTPEFEGVTTSTSINVEEELATLKEAEVAGNLTTEEGDRSRRSEGLDNGMLIPQPTNGRYPYFDDNLGFESGDPYKRNVIEDKIETSSEGWKELGVALIAEGDEVKWEPKTLDEFLKNLMKQREIGNGLNRRRRFARQKRNSSNPEMEMSPSASGRKTIGNQSAERLAVDVETSATLKTSHSKKKKRNISEFLKIPPVTDLSLQLQNGMFDSHVSKDTDLYRILPKFLFLVDGAIDTPVPMMTYTNVFPFAYIPRLHCKALEFPLDDERYKLLILLPVERRGLRQLIYDLGSYPLREVMSDLRPARVKAMVPTFMVEGFVILTPTLQKMGIWDVFDPRRADLSGMTSDPDLYVRNIEQSVTVVIRNYVEILDIQTRTMAARHLEEDFTASHPFLYFVMDTATNVALMAGQMLDPLNSRIY